MRYVGISFPPKDSTDSSLFKALKIWSLDVVCVEFVRHKVKLPKNAEVLHVPYCNSYVNKGVLVFNFLEEFYLATLVRSTSLPKVRLVVVPAVPLDPDGKPPSASIDLNNWKENRKALENLEAFKSDEVLLKKLKVGDMGE